MTRTYYSNGKLLISGEYLVLHGAASLVVPLKVGQHMRVTAIGYEKMPVIYWHANILGEPWFYAHISFTERKILKTNDWAVAGKLLEILQETAKLNPLLFEPQTGYEIDTDTGFSNNWGFGSSSALIANIAQWAVIDPFELHFRIFDGSGADIAAAISGGPVLYRLIESKANYGRVDFQPSFINKLWLIYQGNKQDTSLSVKNFRESAVVTDQSIRIIDRITLAMIQSETLNEFMNLMVQHEKTLSELLGKPPVKDEFPDFPGEIKSLGAWGGDFILAASEQDEMIIKEYFVNKQMHTVFSMDQIVLQ